MNNIPLSPKKKITHKLKILLFWCLLLFFSLFVLEVGTRIIYFAKNNFNTYYLFYGYGTIKSIMAEKLGLSVKEVIQNVDGKEYFKFSPDQTLTQGTNALLI